MSPARCSTAVVSIALIVATAAVSQTGATVKVRGRVSVLAPFLEGEPHHELARTEHWTLYRIRRDLFETLPADVRARIQEVDDAIHLPSGPWDTYHRPLDLGPSEIAEPEGEAFYLIQPYLDAEPDPPYPAPTIWFPASAALRWTKPTERAALDAAVFAPDLFSVQEASAPPHALQHAGPLHPPFKIDAALDSGSATPASVRVWLIRRPGLRDALDRIAARSHSPLEVRESAWTVAADARLDGPALLQIAREPLVFWLQPVSWNRSVPPCGWPVLGGLATIAAPEGLLDVVPGTLERIAALNGREHFRVTADRLDALDVGLRLGIEIAPQGLRLSFSGECGPGLDAREPVDAVGPAPIMRSDGLGLTVVQYLVGSSSSRTWRYRVMEAGAWPVGTLPWAGDVVWSGSNSRAALDAMVAPAGLFSQPAASDPPLVLGLQEAVRPAWKIAPALLEPGPAYRHAVVSLFRNAQASETRAMIEARSPSPVARSAGIDGELVAAWLDVSSLWEVARQPDVVSIEAPASPSSPWHLIRWNQEGTLRLLAPTGLFDASREGVQRLPRASDSPSREHVRVAETELDAIDPGERRHLELRPDWIELDSFTFDSQDDVLEVPSDLRVDPTAGPTLWLLQFLDLPDEEWEAELLERGARIVYRLSLFAAVAWIHPDDVEAVGDLVHPPPWAEDMAPGGPRFLQYLSPLHTLFRVPVWVQASDPVPADPEFLQVLLALDQAGESPTRVLLDARYGEPDDVQQVGESSELRLYYPVTPNPTPQELIGLARERDVIFAGDLRARWLGGPSGGPPTTGPGPPGSGGGDPNVAAAIPTASPGVLVLLALFLGLTGLAISSRS